MESSLNIQKIVKPSFAVIGIEGSTDDGEGFIPMLWSDANAHFDEVSPVASRDENGALLGMWGVMSDETRSFLPWTDGFSRVCTSRAWNVPSTRKCRMGGRSGSCRGMSTLP